MSDRPKKQRVDNVDSVALQKERNKRYYAARKAANELRNRTPPDHTPSVLVTSFTSAIPVGPSASQHPHNQTPPPRRNRIKPNSHYSGPQAEPHTPLTRFPHIIDNTPLIDPSTAHDPYNFVFEGLPTSHRILKEMTPCPRCAAKRFPFEFPTFCCMEGKTVLAHTDIPEQLHHLYTTQEDIGRVFRENIRAYNTNFSFASMGVSLDETMTNMTGGVYTFRAHKGIYHKIDQLVSRDGTPRYLQLYFYDPDTELEHRLRWPNLDGTITRILTQALSTNPYMITFRRLADLGPLDKYRITINASVELDQRVYNRPTTSEVAGIWVEGNDNITAYKRSIIVYGRSEHQQTIQPYYSCYDPLSYPLFFPNGEPGWHSNIPRRGVVATETQNNQNTMEDDIDELDTRRSRTTVAMREYYCYRFQVRPTANILLLGGRLLQQFTVDVYIKVETSRLHYYERNQPRIRAELYQGIVDCVNAGDAHPTTIGRRIVLPASFIGGPRDMRRRFLDAMTLVQDDGKPDLFLTITCNPQWPEISLNLHPGQTAQDRPDLVSRVFRAKLEDLKEQLFKKHIFGEVRAHVYVIEFQKRGLPHAHFLLMMYPQYKIINPDQYDKFVCAEIPDIQRHPQLHAVVVKNMIHGPCGTLRMNSPCMQGDPKKCRFHYPRQFNDHTTQGDDAYPLYRRRNNGIKLDIRGKTLDNRWVVPYNPTLLMMFNCHINVEICSSVKSVKYLFKYIYKGHDKQVIQIDPDANDVVINEIKRFQDARYVSPPEAMWRIFSFPLSQIYPAVLALQLHLPKNHSVTFTNTDIMSEVIHRERDKNTMLTAFFEKNRQDPTARQYLYKDFPAHYTWNKGDAIWKTRKIKPRRGRIVSANPAEGERYYLRLLLTHIRGPTSFEHLRTIQGVEHPTFRKAALEKGLIENDNSLSQCLHEAAVFQFPTALRRLFATILVFCEPGDVRQLWVDHFDTLSEDHQRHSQNKAHIQNLVLQEIGSYLESMGKTLFDFDLPPMSNDVTTVDVTHRDTQDELNIIVDPAHLHAQHTLNPDQQSVFHEVMHHVNRNLPGVFFIDGPGGTGKTYLYNALLAEVRSRGLIALATASSGVAANNMPGGRTAHSRFKIPINLTNNCMCSIKKQSGAARLINSARLIIWDEASMANRQSIEAVDRTLQDITGITLPFGGKIMVMGGDFRQVLPVIKKGTRAQIVDASLRMSPLWSLTKRMQLSINMRAINDPWYSQFLLRVGDGTEPTIDGAFIKIPEDMAIPFTTRDNSIKELIKAIFPSLHTNAESSDCITSRAILTTKNENVDEINDHIIGIFQGEEKLYYSFDTAEDDQKNLYPTDFLNSLTISGLPPHKLRLKTGCPIILLRNIDPPNGLCNGTRLICRAFGHNVIDAEIAIGDHSGKRVFLPRIPMTLPEDNMFPFKLKRKQFPVRLSFSMTINKSQGQTIPYVGIYLPESVFSHGQLYVALSRSKSRQNTKVLVHPAKRFTQPGIHTSNVVYREVLQP
ncbi:uncharacterized protein LOC110944175 [Helianthus annuus]|uniref:uncharacterized protein LOC110944175 n=1 Tax=Helianthus annuus TaxID=4232 RepID=UPI000B8FC668|nr:uncharacterized protein LOC110944175 [Helianthus annuus]